MCDAFSAKREAFAAFGLPTPPKWPAFESDVAHHVTSTCDPSTPVETQGGEIVVHKRKAWKGLALSLVVNMNHIFAYKYLIYGDKNVNQVRRLHFTLHFRFDDSIAVHL